MRVHTFIAESAVDAVAQIRHELGPEAVVLHVRPSPAAGFSRLWKRRRIEVVACLPDSTDANTAASDRDSNHADQHGGTTPADAPEVCPIAEESQLQPLAQLRPGNFSLGPGPPPVEMRTEAWHIGGFLEKGGLLPIYAQQIEEELERMRPRISSPSLGQELHHVRAILSRLWREGPEPEIFSSGAHVLVGPAGVGKTICLCKWLAQAVLLQGCSATVWRLDGATANTAELLSVYSEILGVRVERSVRCEAPSPQGQLLLIDIPGVDWKDPAALSNLAGQLRELPPARVHLVLNAAYEVPLLLAQARAFAALPVAGVIATHLDEEPRWGKLWNLLLGTSFSIECLSAGQNVPGDWIRATPESIFARQFPPKQAVAQCSSGICARWQSVC